MLFWLTSLVCSFLVLLAAISTVRSSSWGLARPQAKFIPPLSARIHVEYYEGIKMNEYSH